MKEIKFRAWDGEKLSLFPMLGFDSTVDLNEQINCSQKNGWELMQFTGLLDKNGKEVYEGDICRVEYIEPKEIKFEKGGFYFGEGTPLSNFHSWSEKIEIIGNIYENPELLQDNQKSE